jgi:hypothetical protein
MDFEVTVRLKAPSLAEAAVRVAAMIHLAPQKFYTYVNGTPLTEDWKDIRTAASGLRAGNAIVTSVKVVKESK